MKVIISHDVDHLFGRDHWFRDLIYPKLWVRSSIQLFKHSITAREWYLRCTSCFRKNRHCLSELMSFDSSHGVPSTFFFGMSNGLGMSYKRNEAKPVILDVHNSGFAVGVHGINYSDPELIRSEKTSFVDLVGFEPCGIRMHYVRFNDMTFENLAEAGYVFDSTEFDKKNCGTLKNPYAVGKMWEFPLTIMDGYLPQSFDGAKEKTLSILDECKKKDLQYICILFHDYQFCDDYTDIRNWYVWLIEYLQSSSDYSFISYENAIKELKDKQ